MPFQKALTVNFIYSCLAQLALSAALMVSSATADARATASPLRGVAAGKFAITDDFFIQFEGAQKINLGDRKNKVFGKEAGPVTETSCDLVDRACLIAKNGDESKECLPGSATYGQKIQEIHAVLPEITKQTLCSVDRYFVYEELGSIGYATVLYAENAVRGTYVGIAKKALEGDASIADLFTMKDQRQFGALQDGQINPIYPRYDISISVSNPSLTYVLVHEASHIYDFYNGVTMDLDCLKSGGTLPFCQVVQNEFTANRWRRNGHMDFPARFQGLESFCYYTCVQAFQGTLETVAVLYESFLGSVFVSPYASSSSAEDFAETSAFHLLTKEERYNFKIGLILGNRTEDLVQRFQSDQFKNLRETIGNVYRQH